MSKFLVAALAAFGIVLVFAYPSSAQEMIKGKVSILESQLTQLIESQNKLTETLSKSLGSNKPESEAEFQKIALQSSAVTTNATPPSLCHYGYQSWPSSNKYKKTAWSTEELLIQTNTPTLIDLNGDGLLDYLFANNNEQTLRMSCVYLNNGTGWDLVHKCYAQGNPSDPRFPPWKFWGDCADTAS